MLARETRQIRKKESIMTTASNKIRWGIIGLGGIAHEFASQFTTFQPEHAELVGVASRSLQKAHDFSEQYNIPKAYGSYEAMCHDPEIDVIYLATPNSYHADNMKTILKAGKHVLCEKAITRNKEELDDVLSLANEKELVVAEAMTIYHMPLFKEIKRRIESGEFGALKMATAYFGSLKEDDPTNRFFSKELGGGALLDIGVYALSFVQYFLNSHPAELQTLMQPYETGVDEMSGIQFKTEEGTLGNVTLSFRAKLPKQGVIACENAYITVMNYPRADKALITYPDGETETIEAGDTEKGLFYEIEDLSLTLLGKEELSGLSYTQSVNATMDAVAKKWGVDLTNTES